MGSLEDVKTTQEIINDVNKYNDTRSQLVFGSSAAKSVNSNNLPYNADQFTSYFDFIEKKQIYGNLLDYQDKEIMNTTQANNANNSGRDSKLMKDFMRRKKKQAVKKPEDEAPVTITSKHQLTRFNKPEEIIRRYTNSELQFNIPMNVNLSHIAQFETNSLSMENYFNEEHEINIPPQSQVISDDANSYQTPIDMLKNHNINQNNYNNLNDKLNLNNGNYNASSQYVSNNNNYNNHNTPDFNNFNNQISPQKNQNNLNKPEISNIPKAPTMAPMAARTSVTMPVIPEPPKMAKAPPVPKMPLPPNSKAIELPQGKDDLRVKIPAVKRASMAEEIFLAAERRRNTVKLPEEDKIGDKKPFGKNAGTGKMSLLDSLKSDNPMARLKKSGSLLTKNPDVLSIKLF